MKKIIGWLLAFLLTGCLVLFCVLYAGWQAVVPALNEGGAPLNRSVTDGEMALISRKITELGELYGFTPGPVIAAVDRETVEEMEHKSAQWWTSILTLGKVGEQPVLQKAKVEQVLREDKALVGDASPEDAQFLASEAAEAVQTSVARIVLPFRQPVIRLGLVEVNKRIDIADMVRFFTGTPWAVLALCALLAGLIALLESRKLRFSLPYIGSALGAAAIVLAVLVILAGNAGIQALLLDASASLALQAETLASAAVLRICVLAGVMLLGCAACFILCRRKRENA
jgi:hypothetical protein